MDIALKEEKQRVINKFTPQKVVMHNKQLQNIYCTFRNISEALLTDDILSQKTNLKSADNNGWNVIF